MALITQALNIDHRLNKTKQRIYRVGVELEGGWKKLPQGTQLTHDGSIRGIELEPELPAAPAAASAGRRTDRWGNPIQELPASQRIMRRNVQIGELVSEPMEPSAVEKWIKAYYPSTSNESCGLHVHMSFKNALHYQRLMVPEYQATIIDHLTRWAKGEGFAKSHCIWSRLEGKNEYCKHEFFPDDQVTQARKNYDHHRRGNRYTAINYPFSMHQTIECRVLPMMKDADQAWRAVKKVLDVTNACLSVMKGKERKLVIDDVTNDMIVEESTIRI